MRLEPQSKLMKTIFVRQCSLGLVAGSIFFAGCARPSAQPEPPTTFTAPTGAPTLPITAQEVAGPQAAPGAPDQQQDAAAAPPVAPNDTNAPAIVERIPPAAKPENVTLSPGLGEVVKLAQAGVGEEVLLAYVDKYSGRFDVGADQILYLNDLGVPETVVTAMLKHDGSPVPNIGAVTPSVVQTQAVSNVPAGQVPEQTAPPTVATAVAPPPTSTEVSYYYDTLSPYGSWIYLSGYGWCWQPTVAVSVSTWRPYCDRGRWYWSDAGWYWYSDYSWGWATFHYGRWYHHPGCGWVWAPGLVWAPSWVSWRYYDGYCGWAPLPPEAHFVSGVGFTYYGRHVAVGFDFGLSPYHYSFVHINNFCDYAPYRYVVPRARVQNFYRNTTVVNNYIVRNNNVVINQGIGRDTIARASQTRVREVSVRTTPVNNMAQVRGDRIDKQGNQLVVYRPQLPKTPPAVRSAQFVARNNATAPVVGRVQQGGGVTAPVGPTHGGAGRTQTGTATPAPESRRAEPARPQPAGREETRPAARPRGNAVERGTRAPQTTPAPQPRPQREQPRAAAPLFGSGTAGATPSPNNLSAREAAPKTAERQAPAQVPRAPAQPEPPAARVRTPAQQPASRRENFNTGRFSDHAVMPPKQVEQLPRYTPPTPAAQRPYTAPGYSIPRPQPAAPQGGAVERARPAPSAGGGRAGGHVETGNRGGRH